MGTKYGPQVTTDGLVSIFDVKNINDNLVVPYTDWKMRSFSGNTEDNEIVIDSSIYDAGLKKFSLDGVSDIVYLPKNVDTKFKWGSTISIRCKPTPGEYIFSDTNGINLFYTETNKALLFSTPNSDSFRPYMSILMDGSNNITLLAGNSNNSFGVLKIDLDSSVLGMKRLDGYQAFTYNYVNGKIVENDGYQWVQSYRGYSQNESFLESDDLTYITNATYINMYLGELDVDASFVYNTGYNYEHKAYKTPKGDAAGTISFGTGSGTSDLDGLNRPRGISVSGDYVFVSDANNHRVMVLNSSDMTYNTHFGETGVTGTDASHFDSPFGNVVNNGKLYICDRQNIRIQIYDVSTLTYLDTITVVYLPYYISANDDYAVITNGATGPSVIEVYDLSTKEVVLQKSFAITGLPYGPGGYGCYGVTALRRYEDEVISFDRGREIRIIDASNLTFTTELNYEGEDSNDIAIDASYYYIACYSPATGVQKINKSDITLAAESITSGTGDGEWSVSYGLDVDSSYLYVADTGNDRVQVLDKTDLSYVSQFNSGGGIDLYRPSTVTIDNGKLYVGNSSPYRIFIYDLSTLAYLDNFATAINPNKIRIWENEIFVQLTYNTYVYDLSTYALKRNNNVSSGSYFPESMGGTALEVYGDNIYYHNRYRLLLLDKEAIVPERLFGSWYKHTLVDNVITDDNVFIDIVFTDDYKIKLYANGVGNSFPEIEYTSDDTFQSLFDLLLGKLEEFYSNIEYDWFAFYNKAKTLEEHINDYKNLNPRN